MKAKKYQRYISLAVVFSLICCMMTPMADYHAESNEISVNDDVQTIAYSVPEIIPYDLPHEIEMSESEKLSVYENGSIIIYHYEQLLLIGSNQPLTDTDAQADAVGKGEPVLHDNGEIVRYSASAGYRLAHDMALPKHTTWQLPNDFSGRISNAQADQMPLYDSETDTVYLYNPYQLAVMAMKDADRQPILDGDAKADTFGTGKLIFPDGEDKPYLTYSGSHNYVLSEYFNSSVKNSASVRKSTPALRNTRSVQYDGRDFQGQVLKNLNGTTYILIGNEDQLRAIGTNAPVYTAVYQRDKTTMVYSGDADLLQSQNGNRDFAFQNFAGDITYYGQDQDTGEIVGAIGYAYDTGKEYSNTENYIVFRDIDLSRGAMAPDKTWEPLMFYGTMTGAKAVDGKIWDNTSITAKTRPVISNVLIKIDENEAIDVAKHMGVGFFATLTTDGRSLTSPQVQVKNIELNQVYVTNKANGLTASNMTVISGLLSYLGYGIGGTLDLLLRAVGLRNVNLKNSLSNLLNARISDETNYATGAFAGKVIGDALIEDCAVTGIVNVTSTHDRTGGFIGYSEGTTKYSGLTNLLNALVTVLSSVLNVVPWLGAGDLITILLNNVLPIQYLIPTGYISPVIRNSTVDGLVGVVGQADTKFAGGFIGQQSGTIIDHCEIKNSTYYVYAATYGGGFAGLSRDAEIRGTITDLGIGLDFSRIQQQSLLNECSITNSNVVVDGGSSMGGFVGALCDSYAVNCTIQGNVDNKLSVRGSGDHIGGFAGLATLGYFLGIGASESNTQYSLLGVVGGLLGSVLSSSNSAQILTLAGVAPSAIMGVEIDCGEIEVSGQKHVGGILGKGDGVYLTESSAAYLRELTFWKYNKMDMPEENEIRSNHLNHLKGVVANESYAGGIAGNVGTASVSGVVNGTLGVGDFIGFTISDVTVDGVDNGYVVTAAQNYAGGGFGTTVGGTIDDVTLNRLKLVYAGGNRSAGFTACAGPGDLANSDGLSLNLLGLNNVLKVENLLSVGEGVEVEINNCNVNGIKDGFRVITAGSNSGDNHFKFTAAGFVSKSNSTKIHDSHVRNLLSVQSGYQDGYAGGFIGTSETGGLADVADEDDIVGIGVNGLVDAIEYLIPEYINCTVTYVDGGFVQADYAGGFVADLQSGTVDNSSRTDDYYAVYHIDHVTGYSYGGGFGGRLVSGALASAGGGISILGDSSLNLSVNDLASVINAYIPIVKYAGVYAEKGFTVSAFDVRADDLLSGSAGGFAGYMSGAQVSYSDVNKLKHTKVTPPDDLEIINAPTYFDGTQSNYAVRGGRYAGGYVGNMDIGSAASVGDGLKVLGQNIQLSNVLSALSVVVSTIEHSDTMGAAGGFSIISGGTDRYGAVGMSGGYAGNISGGHIQDSHARNFAYIIGAEAAGGYVGNFIPGNAANVLGDGSVLGLVDVGSSLASLVEDFVPTIRNSTTTCIPCGGAVRAYAPSDSQIQRGMAGGYCGHNEGGHIWGFDNHTWKDQNDGILFHEDENHIIQQINTGHNTEGRYIGVKSECRADRIRSVYGYEYAGGFTGFMENADTADTGNISLLGGLIQANNILNALSAVYPTEENTAVYGPLSNLDVDTWNMWIDYVGKYGEHGMELLKVGKISKQNKTPEQIQNELDAKLKKYIYGYNVVAGRPIHEQMIITEGGNAGGYVGYMLSGVITNGQGYDAKLVRAMRNAGGFAGKMQTGGAADFGGVNILGLNLNVGSLVKAVQVFVPTVKSSSVKGYQSGLTVMATGDDFIHHCGYAGGYVGSAYGAQIWGDKNVDTSTPKGCNITNLKFVQGRNAVGGYVGLATAASVADVNTNSSDGLLQKVLNSVISSPGDLAQVVQATVTTIRQAEVSAYDAQYGYSVKGTVQTSYPRYAGGFAGSLEAAIIGKESDTENKIKVKDLREVDGGYYAGGFFGLADVTSAAAVSNSGEEQTSVLGLVKAQQVSVLDAFRTYIYHAQVKGTEENFSDEEHTVIAHEGIIVRAHDVDMLGLLESSIYSGCAGGFGGGMMNGTVKNSSVSNVNTVTGLNYVGGFIGHLGRGGAVDADGVGLLDLIDLSAGVLDVFGSVNEDCSVEGIDAGMVVLSGNSEQPVSGGFAGFSDISKIKNCHITKQKQVYSDKIAGGFVGKTEMSYLVNVQAKSLLVNGLLEWVVNPLLRALYLHKLQNLPLPPIIDITLGEGRILSLSLLSDGDVISLTLLGLPISISLIKSADLNTTDTAVIRLGDSEIRLPCTESGGVNSDDVNNNENANVVIHLLKGNYARVTDSTVKGIAIGYDVYGGGATNTSADGSNINGYAGGFVGYNKEGRLLDNQMIYCDVVKGYAGKVGHFNGFSVFDTVYDHDVSEIEQRNQYSVYRQVSSDYQYALTSSHTAIATQVQDTETAVTYNRYDVVHRASPIAEYADWENAVMAKTSSGGEAIPINVYASSAKAVLMLDTPTELNGEGVVPDPGEYTDPCYRVLTYKKLTLRKIWDDNLNGNRPESIKVRIWQYNHYADGTEILDAEGNSTKMIYRKLDGVDSDGFIEISKTVNGTADNNIWKYVIENLPASSVSEDDETGEQSIIYYSYRIEELSVDGYTTTISYETSDSEFLIDITNSIRPNLLPHTGGQGVMIWILTGLGIFILALYSFIRIKWKYYITYE